TDRANARLSVSSDQIQGIIPNNLLSKVTTLLSGGVEVSDKLSTNGSIQYIRNTGRNRPPTGYSGQAASILESFVWFGRQVDVNELRNMWRQSGALNGGPADREFNWNYNYHLNPFWWQNANPQLDARDRFIGSLSATYKVTDWLNGTLRSGSDIYRYGIDLRFANNGGVNGFPDPSYYGGFVQTN